LALELELGPIGRSCLLFLFFQYLRVFHRLLRVRLIREAHLNIGFGLGDAEKLFESLLGGFLGSLDSAIEAGYAIILPIKDSLCVRLLQVELFLLHALFERL